MRSTADNTSPSLPEARCLRSGCAEMSSLRHRAAWVIATAVCTSASGGVQAGQSAVPVPVVEEGGRAFQNTCANCHGPDGDQVPGIHLGRGQFRRALTDQELTGIIRNGIPGTSMPGSNMSADLAARIVA